MTISGRRKSPLGPADTSLLARVQAVMDAYETIGAKAKLYAAIKKELYPLALLSYLNEELDGILQERNILPISRQNVMIANEVREQSPVFLFERLGEKFTHYMLDEFQDTNRLQWHNMLPLLSEGLATGHESLIVGDGKQSIYRWRGGDLEQFTALTNPNPTQALALQSSLGEYANVATARSIQVLGVNYRSTPVVVGFNNALFAFLRTMLANTAPDASLVYGSLEQKMPSGYAGPQGYVEISFTQKPSKPKPGTLESDTDRQMTIRVIDAVNRARRDGFAYADITGAGAHQSTCHESGRRPGRIPHPCEQCRGPARGRQRAGAVFGELAALARPAPHPAFPSRNSALYPIAPAPPRWRLRL